MNCASLVIAQFQVQYDQCFLSFSNVGALSNSKIEETKRILSLLYNVTMKHLLSVNPSFIKGSNKNPIIIFFRLNSF